MPNVVKDGPSQSYLSNSKKRINSTQRLLSSPGDVAIESNIEMELKIAKTVMDDAVRSLDSSGRGFLDPESDDNDGSAEDKLGSYLDESYPVRCDIFELKFNSTTTMERHRRHKHEYDEQEDNNDFIDDWLEKVGGPDLVKYVFQAFNEELKSMTSVDFHHKIASNLANLKQRAQAYSDIKITIFTLKILTPTTKTTRKEN